jgi:DNA-binding CsgD family transcriptional regulator
MASSKPIVHRTRRLSQKQRIVAALVAQGLKNREIGTDLGIATHVVRNYLNAIFDKVGHEQSRRIGSVV